MLLPWKKNHPELHFSCARYYFCSTKADQKSFGPLDGLLVDKRYFQSRSTGILGTNAKTRIGADTQCSTKCTCFQTVEGLYILNRKVGSILLVSGQTSLKLEFYEGVFKRLVLCLVWLDELNWQILFCPCFSSQICTPMLEFWGHFCVPPIYQLGKPWDLRNLMEFGRQTLTQKIKQLTRAALMGLFRLEHLISP